MFVYVLNVFLHFILFIVIYLLCNMVYYTEDNKYILLLLLLVKHNVRRSLSDFWSPKCSLHCDKIGPH